MTGMTNLEAIEILTYIQSCCNQCEYKECPYKEMVIIAKFIKR